MSLPVEKDVILKRVSGIQYEIAELQKLGELGIVDKPYAEKKLVLMAKYRNRLVHFYAEITEKELYGIIQNNLGDFDMFLQAVKELLEHPEKFNLAIE